jgi:hypothetical protein
MIAAHIRTFVLLAVVSLVAACGSPFIHKHTINAAYDVRISDPDLRLFTDVTARIDLVASGEFKDGSYVINNKSIGFAPGTQFRLQLTLPINEPDLIHTNDASGSLWTSLPISVNGIPAPQIVQLSKGQVSGQVDLVRTLGAFLLGCLQTSVGESGDVRQMVQSLSVERATLRLRPDSNMMFGEKNLHIGKESTISFRNVSIDHDLNYDGSFNMHLRFLDGCHWIGRRTSCDFQGGNVDVDLHATKRNGVIDLSLIKNKNNNPVITLERSWFQFGKDKRSSSKSQVCIIHPSAMSWRFLKGNPHPQFHMHGPVEMKDSVLDVKTDIQETIANFPATVPAQIRVDSDGTKRTLQFATTEAATAESAQIKISKKATSLTIKLANASVGPASLDKSGEFTFALESGSAQLRQLDWRASKGNFVLTPAPGSEVSIPSGMFLGNTNARETTQLNMPLDVSLGDATIHGLSRNINLSELSGKLLISIDKEVQITGDLGFRVPESSLFGGKPLDLKARGLDLAVANGKAILRMRNCVARVPIGAIQEAINDKMPHDFSMEMHKTLSGNEKWRYRDAIAEKVSVRNFELDNMEPIGPGKVAFTALGDVTVDGTVEQGNPEDGNYKNLVWEKRPWKLSGHVEGEGNVEYKFLSGSGPQGNRVEYNLDMDVPMPSDIKLDWSQVAHGVLGFVERKVILGHLHKLTVPLKYNGTLGIISEESPLGKNFKISNMVAKRINDATEVDFDATATF